MADKIHKFPCRQCGADLVFSPGAQSLKCEYCGFVEQIPQSKDAIVEYPYSDTLAPPRERGWGAERRSIRCENCGATSTDDPQVVSSRCPFCGSPRVVESAPSPDLIRPEALLPFAVDHHKARDAYRRWISSLWFRPSNLARESTLASIAGMYVPYWTFDANTNSYWEAEAGYYYYTTESYIEGGRSKTRQVRQVRWEHASGRYDAFFDDELVCASTGVPGPLARAVEPYDTTSLVPYDSKYLSGWKAEQYSVDLKEGWKRGKAQIDTKIRGECSRQVPGDTQRNLRVQSAFSGITYKHVLLPIWIAAFLYGGKSYQVMINGRTGLVSGKAPFSWVKIVFAVIAALIVFLLIVKLGG